MHFGPEFNQFFKDLAANNHKEWFDDNRGRYEQHVKKPFVEFTAALIDAIAPSMPGIDPDARKAIFRINRDVRFSKDKAPYKLQAAAYLSPYGKKDPSHSGFYYQLGPEHIMLAGGLYMPDATTLRRTRHYIAAHPNRLYDIMNDVVFKEYYGSIKGEENKRIADAALHAAAAEHPILLKKQMYVEAVLPASDVTRPDLLEVVLAHANAGLPLFQYFAEATAPPADNF